MFTTSSEQAEIEETLAVNCSHNTPPLLGTLHPVSLQLQASAVLRSFSVRKARGSWLGHESCHLHSKAGKRTPGQASWALLNRILILGTSVLNTPSRDMGHVLTSEIAGQAQQQVFMKNRPQNCERGGSSRSCCCCKITGRGGTAPQCQLRYNGRKPKVTHLARPSSSFASSMPGHSAAC